MVLAGLLLGIFSILGFRHAGKVSATHNEGAPGERPGVRRPNTLERAASAPGRFTGGARLQAGSFYLRTVGTAIGAPRIDGGS